MELCTYPGCDRDQKTYGLCPAHRIQQSRGEDLHPIPPLQRRKKGTGKGVCSFLDCGRGVDSHGLCKYHRRMERDGIPLRPIRGKAEYWKLMTPEERERRLSGLKPGEYVRSEATRKKLSESQRALHRARSNNGQGPQFKDKECRGCGRTFKPNSGRQVYCNKECSAENLTYQQKYGLSAAQVHLQWELQGKACALCGLDVKLVVDHDHVTGKARGLLCNKCNTALGKFQDSPELLRKAAQYVEQGGYISPT